jgi:DUF4097 and DUF4098 domain-containing protein YvlB
MRSETFSTPGPLLLNLEIPAGRIEIETGNTDETHVELEAHSNNEEVQEMVEASRIELVRRGDRYEVVVETRTRHGIWISFSKGPDIRLGQPEIHLRVTCPHGADLDVRTKSADLEARGQYGTVDMKTASGDVSVEQTRDVRVKTASGDVHLDQVDGSLDVNSASGDLHAGAVARDANVQLVSGDLFIREAGSSVSANTVSGDQRLEAVAQGRMELRAISGDITVGIRQGARLFVDANTISGSTSSEFELGDSPAGQAAPDGPLVEVFAKTVSGDVRIERAPAAQETGTELSKNA